MNAQTGAPSPDTAGRSTGDPRNLLAGHPLFAALDPAERARLLSYAVTQRYAAGDLVFRKDDPGTEMSLIVSGQIKIRVGGEGGGKEAVLALLGPGEVLGELALLDGKERSADAIAMVPTTLLSLQRRDFVDAIKRRPEVAIGVLSVLCARLRRTSVAVEDRYLLNFSARLAKTLLSLAASGGAATAPGTVVVLPMSQGAMASMIGCSRETLNKQLHVWQDAGLIRVRRRQITLLDPEGLAGIAEA